MLESSTVIFLLLGCAVIFFMIGWVVNRKRSQDAVTSKRIEEYDFYPFINNAQGHVEFNTDLFTKAVRYLLNHRNAFAARQLIVIGEQNLVRDTLSSDDLTQYKKLYNAYGGQSIINDNDQYLENYKRLVQLIGKSFPGTGIEILLHNLVNPSRSVIAIENGEVTGRKIESGTTNLVLDLKMRKMHNQDKLNYGLTIGSRNFKCTTIPIFRPEYGLVGAICINVDVNFLRDEVLSSQGKMVSFIEQMVKRDFELNEVILSKEEYQKALDGKRHFLDDVFLREAHQTGRQRQLLAILFSDIVDFSAMMGSNEQVALESVEKNHRIHQRLVQKYQGDLLKEIGDGTLASFHSAMEAVQFAIDLVREIAEHEQYKLRVGIHLGEVISSGRDVFGDGVNIASRIYTSAQPNTICISAEVYNNVKNKLDIDVEPLSDVILKNINQKVELYLIK